MGIRNYEHQGTRKHPEQNGSGNRTCQNIQKKYLLTKISKLNKFQEIQKIQQCLRGLVPVSREHELVVRIEKNGHHITDIVMFYGALQSGWL